MTRSWTDIWAARELDRSHDSVLQGLLAADGYDTAFSPLSDQSWRNFAGHVAEQLGITPGSSVLEIGCGAGAFLYPLREMGCAVSGCDPSPALVAYAQEAMPEGDFVVADAVGFADGRQFDFVVSCGVFLYFPSTEYARSALKNMAKHARHGLAVLEVLDQALSEQAVAARRSAVDDQTYERDYRGLEHCSFDRAWLLTALQEEGATQRWAESQVIADYPSGAFRFNAYARFTEGTPR